MTALWVVCKAVNVSLCLNTSSAFWNTGLWCSGVKMCQKELWWIFWVYHLTCGAFRNKNMRLTQPFHCSVRSVLYKCLCYQMHLYTHDTPQSVSWVLTNLTCDASWKHSHYYFFIISCSTARKQWKHLFQKQKTAKSFSANAVCRVQH